MFNSLQQQPADKILALMQLYKEDPRENKIDLGVGVYKDASGQTPIMQSIKKAEHLLWKTQETKSYVGLTGTPEFSEVMINLLLGDKFDKSLTASAATPGGTGAVRQAFELGKMANPNLRVFVSDPTWPNHLSILKYLGISVEPYRYFDAETRSVDFSAMMADLANANEGDVILLHASCHNPTGMDPTAQQWMEIAKVIENRGIIPFIDNAYQGLANGLSEDAFAIKILKNKVSEMLISSSCSKNFGLYRDRSGTLTIISNDSKNNLSARSHLLKIVRTMCSVPPDHGCAVVSHILNNLKLRERWITELSEVRNRLKAMRIKLSEALNSRSKDFDFSHLTRANGMFSYLGVTSEQVKILKIN